MGPPFTLRRVRERLARWRLVPYPCPHRATRTLNEEVYPHRTRRPNDVELGLAWLQYESGRGQHITLLGRFWAYNTKPLGGYPCCCPHRKATCKRRSWVLFDVPVVCQPWVCSGLFTNPSASLCVPFAQWMLHVAERLQHYLFCPFLVSANSEEAYQQLCFDERFMHVFGWACISLQWLPSYYTARV